MSLAELFSYVSVSLSLISIAALFIARNYNEWRYTVRLKPGSPPLPPGTMGWPLIGETLQLMKEDYVQIYRQKSSQYGRIWKTHLFGNPTICTTTAESARNVLVLKQSQFEAHYPDSFKQILGSKNFMFLRGADHIKVKRFYQAALRPEYIRNCVAQVEDMAMLSLQDLDGKTVSVLREARKFSFNAVISLLFGESPSEEMEKLWTEFELLDKAIFSLAINLPGSDFHNGLKARQRILSFLKKKFKERRYDTAVEHHDVLDLMMKPIDDYTLTDEEIADSLLAGLFAGQDTSATALHWAVFHLSQNPEQLEYLIAEVNDVRRGKNCGESMNWDDFKNMPFTSAVMIESVRLNVASFLMRQAQNDVVIEGHTIPKGWTVIAWTRFFHTDPLNFEDPSSFNPRRHLDGSTTANLMIWGGGMRTCPGYEFAKLEGAAFLYHLVSQYTWEVLPNCNRKTVNMPVPHLNDGLQIRLHKREV